MRAAPILCVGVLMLAAIPLVAVSDDKIPPDGAAWGCAGAAYFDKVEGQGDAAYRSLYTSYFAEGSDSELVDSVVTLPEGTVFADHAPRCWDVDGDGAPDPFVVERDARKTSLRVYVQGKAAIEIDAVPADRGISPVALTALSAPDGALIAYLSVGSDSADLIIARIQDGTATEVGRAAGFADPTGRDHRVVEFVRDCGQGPELVLPSTDWRALEVVRLAAAGLERDILARTPDFSRLVRALECHKE